MHAEAETAGASAKPAAGSKVAEGVLYGDAEVAKMNSRLEAWVRHHLTPQSRAGLPKTRASLLRALRTDLGSLRRRVVPPDVLFKRLVLSGHIEIVKEEADEARLRESGDAWEDDSDDGEQRHHVRSHGGRARGPKRPYRLVFHTEPKPLPCPRRIRFDEEGLPLPSGPEGDGGTDMAEEEEAFATRSEAEEAAMRRAERWALRMAADSRVQPTSVEAAQCVLAQLAVVDVGYPAERLVHRLEEQGYISLVPPSDDTVKRAKRGRREHQPDQQGLMGVVWLLGSDKEKRKQEEEDSKTTEDGVRAGKKRSTNGLGM